MRSEINCCKDCAERKLGCHQTCEKYIKARKDLEEKKEKSRLELEGALYSIEKHFKIERYVRNTRR